MLKEAVVNLKLTQQFQAYGIPDKEIFTVIHTSVIDYLKKLGWEVEVDLIAVVGRPEEEMDEWGRYLTKGE